MTSISSRITSLLCLQLFRQRLSHESVKAYARMPIGIMGSKSLALLALLIDCLALLDCVPATKNEKERIRVCAVSFYHAETP